MKNDQYCAFMNAEGELKVLPCNMVGAHNVTAMLSGGDKIQPICHAGTEHEALEQAQTIIDAVNTQDIFVCQY